MKGDYDYDLNQFFTAEPLTKTFQKSYIQRWGIFFSYLGSTPSICAKLFQEMGVCVCDLPPKSSGGGGGGV